jgi:hypothetical protein
MRTTEWNLWQSVEINCEDTCNNETKMSSSISMKQMEFQIHRTLSRNGRTEHELIVIRG